MTNFIFFPLSISGGERQTKKNGESQGRASHNNSRPLLSHVVNRNNPQKLISLP
jgi:hypothetical protein